MRFSSRSWFCKGSFFFLYLVHWHFSHLQNAHIAILYLSSWENQTFASPLISRRLLLIRDNGRWRVAWDITHCFIFQIIRTFMSDDRFETGHGHRSGKKVLKLRCEPVRRTFHSKQNFYHEKYFYMFFSRITNLRSVFLK